MMIEFERHSVFIWLQNNWGIKRYYNTQNMPLRIYKILYHYAWDKDTQMFLNFKHSYNFNVIFLALAKL